MDGLPLLVIFSDPLRREHGHVSLCFAWSFAIARRFRLLGGAADGMEQIGSVGRGNDTVTEPLCCQFVDNPSVFMVLSV
jgi:hypothetical protein